MWRRILGISAGVMIGAALAALCVWMLAPPPPPESWTDYPTLANTAFPPGPVVLQQVGSERQYRLWLLVAIVCGGGFGAITGAIVTGQRRQRE